MAIELDSLSSWICNSGAIISYMRDSHLKVDYYNFKFEW